MQNVERTSEIRPAKRGQWTERRVGEVKTIDAWQSARCTVCRLYYTSPYLYFFNDYNYCPYCGADMRGD